MYFQYRKLYPFIYYFSNFTHSYTFGWKRYPIDILLRWKSYPFIYLDAWKSSRTSVYTFIWKLPPPPVTANTTTGFRGGWYPGYHLSCPPPPPALHGKSGGNEPGSTKVSVLTMYWFCLTARSTFSRVGRPPRGQGTYPWYHLPLNLVNTTN